MSTNTPTSVEVWLDEDELDELGRRLERIVQRSREVVPPPRPTFFVDYHEAE